MRQVMETAASYLRPGAPVEMDGYLSLPGLTWREIMR
jgi:hypothetical protein